tara:strand:+ start:799 stop:2205 length:1407 start_codon:yes stop_codon:yes gene_type:complete
MGLLDGTTHKQYYQGNDFGNYQFISLNDIITQFYIMYVGEDKLIPKAKRADIAFHAKRALAELSFDTFKSIKSQQIVVPPSLTMVLPHDYVNYTKISRVDSAGIKRVLYPTKLTSNPFEIKQQETGEYDFPINENLILNSDFSNGLNDYQHTTKGPTVESGVLKFNHKGGFDYSPAVWQAIDVTNINFITISADGVGNAVVGDEVAGILRFGLSTQPGDANVNSLGIGGFGGDSEIPPSLNASTDIFDITFLEWNGISSTQTAENIDVSQYDIIYALITSNAPGSVAGTNIQNTIDNLSVTNSLGSDFLNHADPAGLNSSTWNKFKANELAEVAIDDYRYEHHLLNPNERYGIEPSHAQINGSFYIDDRLGKIHFSSNISGLNVILDYISDSLGTDDEMHVHKFAEDAMYKHILYDVISTRSNIGGSRLSFHKREKFAAVRKAKLRLSSIKLEELTQILRGQSKHIKH